jgi:hypothetical protein
MMPTKDEMKSFAVEIENIVTETDYNYIEAIIEYCKNTGMEIEVASTLVNNNLKSKIENDAQDLNLLPKTARLPI